eukprot:8896466-Pyramimonas_sp.AAC.3
MSLSVGLGLASRGLRVSSSGEASTVSDKRGTQVLFKARFLPANRAHRSLVKSTSLVGSKINGQVAETDDCQDAGWGHSMRVSRRDFAEGVVLLTSLQAAPSAAVDTLPSRLSKPINSYGNLVEDLRS